MKLRIKPSAKIKKRYILFEKTSRKEIERVILEYIGVLGWTKASPVFVENKEKKIILSVDRSAVNNIRAAFEAAETKADIVRVSGTIKGLNRNL